MKCKNTDLGDGHRAMPACATTAYTTIKLSRIWAGATLKKGLYLLCLSNESTKVSSKLIIK
jgi:hypothetical protein